MSQARRADVLNRGFSGYNTKWALSALPHVIGSWDGAVHSPDLVTIFFGANDASLPDLNARQHVPVAEYQANLLQMVGQIRAVAPGARVVIITPPPVGHAQRLEYQKQRYPNSPSGKLERTNETTGRYAAAAAQVAERCENSALLDLWGTMQAEKPVDEGWTEFLRCAAPHRDRSRVHQRSTERERERERERESTAQHA